ncbi:hypothetical protein E0Z06_04630 [Rheinheimera sp. D18]|uniref:hypothetical protein n=1 Tax=Rheinheimera sp. D18 TaxID=2545632 RepID=UPI00104C1880|nr:hypothetical protein [Rheinheimera sp. D18]QBL08845.1 hypothetical protein E0Z06_04630 [Rheinheimera sp. D18]
MTSLTIAQSALSNESNANTDTSLFDLTNPFFKQIESLEIDVTHILSLLQSASGVPELHDKNRELRIVRYGYAYECTKGLYRVILSRDELLQRSSETAELEEIEVTAYAVYQHVKPFIQKCVDNGIGCYISHEYADILNNSDDRVFCYLMTADKSARLYAVSHNKLAVYSLSLSVLFYKFFLKSRKQTPFRDWTYIAPEVLQKLLC